MGLKNVPLKSPVVSDTGILTNIWTLFFNEMRSLLDNSQPQQIPSYTVSTLPSAASYEGHLIYVSNESGGKTIAFSDATNWRRVQDRAIVS